MENIEKIQQFYQAFDQGNMNESIKFMSEDLRWEYHPTGNSAQENDIPYMRYREGKEAIAGFLQDIEQDFDMHSIEFGTLMEGEDKVAVFISYELTVKATGKKIRDEEIHLWEFGPDGKIVAFRHFLDTGKAISAHS